MLKDSRYRLVFERFGAISFLSHLDMQRVLQKAIKRAGLPVSFSKGFNPHQLTSFALPLSTGMEAENEYFEIEFDTKQDCAKLIDSMNAVLPEGIRITAASITEAGEKTAAALLYGAVYSVTAPYDEKLAGALDGIIDAIIASKKIIVNKRTKDGTKEIEMREKIYELKNISSENETKLSMSIAAGSSQSIKPETICEYIYKSAGLEFYSHMLRYLRKRLLLTENKSVST